MSFLDFLPGNKVNYIHGWLQFQQQKAGCLLKSSKIISPPKRFYQLNSAPVEHPDPRIMSTIHPKFDQFSNPRHIEATSIGSIAFESLKSEMDGKIHGVTSRGIFIKTTG